MFENHQKVSFEFSRQKLYREVQMLILKHCVEILNVGKLNSFITSFQNKIQWVQREEDF